MADFLLELLSEEIPARMQDKARADLARLFAEQLAAAGLKAEAIETFATPRRLALIARGLPEETAAVSEELKGPRTSAPPQALEGFLRKTGLTQDQLAERDGVWFAQIDKPGRATASVLAEAIPAIVRTFPWPKSMRWGAASVSTESLRWVRPLHGIVALLGEEIVDCEVAGVKSGAATVGHRFHHPGVITIGGAHDYAEKLRACHVLIDADERKAIIRDGARAAAEAAGLRLIADEPLVAENAGLTEWPMPLLGRFDPVFLDVPPEIIQLTARLNQKYFVCIPPRDGEGDRSPEANGGGGPALAPNFVCIANLDAADGGARIVEGNRKVLAARLADARFFWEQDLKVPLEDQAAKLGQIVFHEKLGTVADKVERVAKLARWLVEEGIVAPAKAGASGREDAEANPAEIPASAGMTLADMAERAARLCKADLDTGLVGEFPELQGVIGGHLARAQSEPAEIADAIRDHYKPVGQGDEVPTSPVTVAVGLADKLDTLFGFFKEGLVPTGSKDPFALRRAAVALLQIVVANRLRFGLSPVILAAGYRYYRQTYSRETRSIFIDVFSGLRTAAGRDPTSAELRAMLDTRMRQSASGDVLEPHADALNSLLSFFADRLKVQQREAGVRHDLIDAVFALGGEDDLVRLLARVKALQAFVETAEGADLLAGYKRAANILKKEGWPSPVAPAKAGASGQEGPAASPPEVPASAGMTTREQGRNKPLSYTPEKAEEALIAALDSAEPAARAAVEAEDFEAAMRALASLRAPVDAFFDKVTVNDPDETKRAARLDLLATMRDAVHRVADFSRIEG
ncbi:MAG: glycine--tRNA ligase subunit beta [Sphingosinicella sp.]|uniref:glycine--tRNA ligase subunit beta n=1 Tax=Sphingosinicella sp. TaxID=1917971 RepID=UPI004037B10C